MRYFLSSVTSELKYDLAPRTVKATATADRQMFRMNECQNSRIRKIMNDRIRIGDVQ